MSASVQGWQRGSFGVDHTPPGLAAALQLLEGVAESRVFEPGKRIHTWGDRTGYWYRLHSGAAKRQGIGDSGNLQIVDFVFPGDWFGLSIRVLHEFATEIIAPHSVICRYPREQIHEALEGRAPLLLEVVDAAFRATTRLQRHMRVLLRPSPQARLAGFLVEMRQRASDAAGNLALPMPLRDIANYLLLSDEEVSEALLQWVADEAIELLGDRHIRVLDARALAAFE